MVFGKNPHAMTWRVDDHDIAWSLMNIMFGLVATTWQEEGHNMAKSLPRRGGLLYVDCFVWTCPQRGHEVTTSW